MGKKVFKIILWSILGIIFLLFLAVLSYFIYLSAGYYRIKDNTELVIENNANSLISLGTEYSITTYNLGFGAYTREFSLFMDEGEMLDGTKTKGTYSRAKNSQTITDNTSGAIELVKELNSDFIFFQEVDVKADRSHNIDQVDMINNAFEDYGNAFTYNFHSRFLFYPLFNPIGSANGGILNLSKYKINLGVRKSLPINTSFFGKFFDLDRCLNISKLKIDDSDKELVLINLHLTAFDGDGTIRQMQFDTINRILKEEREKGNYVIAGGDFNYDIANSCGKYPTTQKKCPWIQDLAPDTITDVRYHFEAPQNAPTCRSSDIPYTKGVNYMVTIDGFLISDNIEKIEVKTIANLEEDTEFIYSDHNPVQLKFKLKK